MAKRVNGDIPEHRKYPWSKWLDGKQWIASAGDDYKRGEVEEFRRTLTSKASERGLKVRTRVLEDGRRMRFQFFQLKKVKK